MKHVPPLLCHLQQAVGNYFTSGHTSVVSNTIKCDNSILHSQLAGVIVGVTGTDNCKTRIIQNIHLIEPQTQKYTYNLWIICNMHDT
jgi:hypothetical protein